VQRVTHTRGVPLGTGAGDASAKFGIVARRQDAIAVIG